MRWSCGWLRGESLDGLARETGQAAGVIAGWREEFLVAGQEGLKTRPVPVEDRRLADAQRKIGELTMDLDIAKALLDEVERRPRSPRRRTSPDGWRPAGARLSHRRGLQVGGCGQAPSTQPLGAQRSTSSAPASGASPATSTNTGCSNATATEPEPGPRDAPSDRHDMIAAFTNRCSVNRVRCGVQHPDPTLQADGTRRRGPSSRWRTCMRWRPQLPAAGGSRATPQDSARPGLGWWAVNGLSRVVLRHHAARRAARRGVAVQRIADALLTAHDRRRRNPRRHGGGADWLLHADGLTIAYNWPDDGDPTTAVVISVWPG